MLNSSARKPFITDMTMISVGHPEQRCRAKRKDRDDRDEPLLAPRAQVAQRQHPLEGSKTVSVSSTDPRISDTSPSPVVAQPTRCVSGQRVRALDEFDQTLERCVGCQIDSVRPSGAP